jgi:hypothetical protein
MHQVGGVIVPISLLWFAWGGRPGVHWMVPSVALVFFNFGLLWVPIWSDRISMLTFSTILQPDIASQIMQHTL